MIHHSFLASKIAYRALSVVLTASILTGCIARSSEPSPQPVYHHRVTALTVRAQDSYQIPRLFTGVVSARQSSELGFELAGKLIKVNYDEGESVRQEQLLAELDTTLLERRRAELQAQIKETKARLNLVKQNLRRIDELNKKGFASAREQDELVSERKVLEATLERLSAALAANATRFEKSRLLAPFDGVISHRLADTGTVVDVGRPVLRLLQTGPLEARVGLPPRLLDMLAPNQPVTLVSAERELNGQVVALNPDVDATTRTVTVRIAAPDHTVLVDGVLIDLRLMETVEQSGFWVPLTALTAGLRGLWNVYVLTPAAEHDRYRLERRDVQIEYAGLDRAFVSGALADGERIVGAGLHRLAPGQIVRLNSSFAQL